LLRVSDMTATTMVAAGVNALVGIASLALARKEPVDAKEARVVSETKPAAPEAPIAAGPDVRPVYLTIALSGTSALGAEVVWTRLLGLMLGATVYTFSIILAVFLVGLGIGSAGGALVSRRVDARGALGASQLALATAIAWTAFMIGQSLPNWPVNPLLSTSPWFTFQIDLVRVIWALLPPTLLWGASFPLALAAAARPGEEPGRLVGAVYAANTLGAILGALIFSLILIPAIGTAGCNRLLILMAALGGLAVLAPRIESTRSIGAAAAATAALVLAVYLAANVGPTPGMLIAYGRRIMISAPRSQLLYSGEGINSSIAITRWDDGAVQFHVSGKVEASTESYDMRLQRMLGHMPALFHSGPRSVLVVGFGAGVTAGTFVVHPEVQRIVICEMEPLIPPVATHFFGNENFHVATDPRTEIVYDDARHFVLTTAEKFDIITSDPIHPWVKGSATLYSREYFQLVKDHLNPGGVVTQWVPLYESNAETVKSEMATFFDVFPNGTVWANDVDGAGYDIFLLGTAEPMRVDLDRLVERMHRPDYARVRESLRSAGFSAITGLLSTYAGQARDLAPWLVGAEINRDGNLRLQYMAGLALNTSQETAIYRQILAYRRPPANLFTGSPDSVEAVMLAMSGGGQSR
jgi:spermidine synthase